MIKYVSNIHRNFHLASPLIQLKLQLIQERMTVRHFCVLFLIKNRTIASEVRYFFSFSFIL